MRQVSGLVQPLVGDCFVFFSHREPSITECRLCARLFICCHFFSTTKTSRLHPNAGDFCCLTMDSESPLPPCWLLPSIFVCHLHKCLWNQQAANKLKIHLRAPMARFQSHTYTNEHLLDGSFFGSRLQLSGITALAQHTHKIFLQPNRTWTCAVDSALRPFTLPPPCWRTRSNRGKTLILLEKEKILRGGPSRPEAEVVEVLI